MFAPLTPQERFNLRPQIVERLLAEHEQAERVRLLAERQAAFQELAVIEREELDALRSLDKDLAGAVTAEKAALKKWSEARNRLGTLRTRRSLLSARFDSRKSRCRAAIAAITPPVVSEFVAELEEDLRTIHPPQGTSEVIEGPVGRDYKAGPAFKVRKSTERSVRERSEAIGNAVQEARSLAVQDLDESELRRRLDALRSSLPEIEFEPTTPVKAAL